MTEIIRDADNPSLNFVVNQGGNIMRAIQYKDDSYNYIDFTFYNAVLHVYKKTKKTSFKDASVSGILLDANTLNGLITKDKTYLSINIPAATVSQLQAGVYDYYLDIISVDLVVTRILSGIFEVQQDISY